MAINFPDTPIDAAIHTDPVTDVSYRYSSATNSWTVVAGPGTVPVVGVQGPQGPQGTQGASIVPLVDILANLPSPSGAGIGARAFVTDSTVVYDGTSAGNIVVGGGANDVPVYSDGTNWRVGG